MIFTNYGFDTNVVASGIARQIFSALHEHSEASLWITPTVRGELVKPDGPLARQARRRILRWSAPVGPQDPNSEAREEAAKRGVAAETEWLNDMVSRRLKSTAVIKLINHSEADQAAVDKLRTEFISAVRIPREREPYTNPDRWIISECMHHRLIPVVTANFRTVHNAINRWAVKHWRQEQTQARIRARQLVILPEDALGQITGHDRKLVYRTILSIAHMPNAQPTPEQMKRALAEFAPKIARSHFPRAAQTVLQCFEEDRDPAATYARIQEKRPLRTLEAERQRREMTRTAARDEGFGFGM